MTDIPRHPILGGMDDEADDFMDDLDKDENKDTRFTQRRFDKYTEKAGELSDRVKTKKKSLPMAFAASQALYVAVINSITETSNQSLG